MHARQAPIQERMIERTWQKPPEVAKEPSVDGCWHPQRWPTLMNGSGDPPRNRIRRRVRQMHEAGDKRRHELVVRVIGFAEVALRAFAVVGQSRVLKRLRMDKAGLDQTDF